MEQQGILLEDVQMKLFKQYLEGDARVWYGIIPHGNISSLKCFHIEFYHYLKIFYPSNSLFEYCCIPLNDEDIPKVNDLAEDVCEGPSQEDIHSHPDASPHEKEGEEGNTIELLSFF